MAADAGDEDMHRAAEQAEAVNAFPIFPMPKAGAATMRTWASAV